MRFLDKIAHNEGWQIGVKIYAAQITAFKEPVPDKYSFLRDGLINLSFDRLELPPEQLFILRLGFVCEGLHIPDTNLKMRYVEGMVAVIEECTDFNNIITLPMGWDRVVHKAQP